MSHYIAFQKCHIYLNKWGSGNQGENGFAKKTFYAYVILPHLTHLHFKTIESGRRPDLGNAKVETNAKPIRKTSTVLL